MTAFNLSIKAPRFGSEVVMFKLLVVRVSYALFCDNLINFIKQSLTKVVDKHSPDFQQFFIRDIAVEHPEKCYLNLV